MSDKLKGCTVTFKRHVSADNGAKLVAAVQMLDGVLEVTPSLDTPDDVINRKRVQHRMEIALHNALREGHFEDMFHENVPLVSEANTNRQRGA